MLRYYFCTEIYFMAFDIDVLDKIVERVETDVVDKLKQVPIQKLLRR